MRIYIPSPKFLPVALVAIASLTAAYGQTTWDFGGSPDKNWSTLTNWSTDASPAATNVVFGNQGTTGSGTSIGNIVDSSYTGGNSLTSLTYSNTGAAAWQVTQIAAGQTLTVTGSFRAGITYAGTGTTTLAAMTGSGTFAVNAPSSSFTVASSSGTAAASRATFDMSNLSSFSANVSTFSLGTGNTGFGTLYLADNSVITTGTFTSGGTGSTYGASTSNFLYFGTTTQMNVDTLAFGGNRTFGTAQFRPAASGAANTSAVTNGVLTLRGSASGTTAVANMTIGAFNGSMPGNGFSVFNLTAGKVDALVSNLTIGSSASTLTNTVGGVLSMASGTFIATNVALGVSTTSSGSSTGTISGTLNVSGGSFVAGTMTLGNNGTGAANNRASLGSLNVSGSGSVTVSGNLVMGVRSGVGAVTSNVTVSAGTLLVQGDMTEGAGGANITSSVNLSGGTLNMDNGNISVDNFTFTGGTLKNVASFTASTTGGLVMQSSTLGFDNINSVSSMALALTGTFSLTGSTNLSLSLASGFNPGASNILLLSNDGGDAITGAFATVNGSGLSTFTLTNDQGSFQYQLSYTGGDGNDLVAIAVPEPGSCALLGVGATMLLWHLRRRPKS